VPGIPDGAPPARLRRLVFRRRRLEGEHGAAFWRVSTSFVVNKGS
jgi:hypothetical protein